MPVDEKVDPLKEKGQSESLRERGMEIEAGETGQLSLMKWR